MSARSSGSGDASKNLDLAESVAGEEDPGASIDMPDSADMPDRPDQPAGRTDNKPQAPVSPGDEAPPGTPGTGENVCPRCGGSGKLAGRDCPECHGTGKVKVGTHYAAQITWQRDGQDFVGNRYSRRHRLRFDGGAEWVGSSSPHVVPVPLSDPAGVDPEEAFVASLASCHMLWFLSTAARKGFCVERYTDNAQGVMARNAAGKMAMTEVMLRPQVLFSGPKQPTREQLNELHHKAHEECYIANSVTTEVRCEPVFPA